MNNNVFLSSTDFDFKGKTVLVRIDCDVDIVADDKEDGGWKVDEDFRLKSIIPTIKFLQEKGVGKIILLGHLGRPLRQAQGRLGKVVPEFSLAPVERKLRELGVGENVSLLENLRFNSGEEENSEEFAKKLAGMGDVSVNEAFGVSHREHASIVGIPKFLPSFLGLRFEEEMKTLSRIKKEAEKPLIFVLGGSKEDKLSYLGFLGEWADKVLVGGKLPFELKVQSEKFKVIIKNLKLRIGNLKTNGRDIDEETINQFKEIIKSAGTVVWAGPMGVYEEKVNEKGTIEVARAIAESNAYKVAGGGDTHKVLSMLNLWDKFDFVSVGGGAMLYFLKSGTLPGIEAIKK